MTLAGLSAGWGARQSRDLTRTMPSPDGCFVQVWNDAGFAGQSDFISGPMGYPHLRDLPSRRSWKDLVGETFSGQSLLLTADRREQGAFAALPLKIQSLDIRRITRPETETR